MLMHVKKLKYLILTEESLLADKDSSKIMDYMQRVMKMHENNNSNEIEKDEKETTNNKIQISEEEINQVIESSIKNTEEEGTQINFAC